MTDLNGKYSSLANALIHEVLKAISEGGKHLLLWGVPPEGVALLTYMVSAGLRDCISGVVDHRTNIQGMRICGYEIQAPSVIPSLELDTLVVAFDEQKELILEDFANLDSRTPRLIFIGTSNYEFNDPVFGEILRACMVKPKSGGYPRMLIHLYQGLRHVIDCNIEGDIAEFGVFQAGTTVFMSKVLNHYKSRKTVYGFDTFGGFPPPRTVLDTYKNAKCEFADYASVQRYCSPYNIELVRGDILDTIPSLEGVPLALSFFDTDNYSATKAALEIVIRQTAHGGILAFDHYYSPDWPNTIGERIAVKQTLCDKPLFNLHGTGVFIKM